MGPASAGVSRGTLGNKQSGGHLSGGRWMLLQVAQTTIPAAQLHLTWASIPGKGLLLLHEPMASN